LLLQPENIYRNSHIYAASRKSASLNRTFGSANKKTFLKLLSYRIEQIFGETTLNILPMVIANLSKNYTEIDNKLKVFLANIST